MTKLYCIKEIVDPRFTDVEFNIGDSVGINEGQMS